MIDILFKHFKKLAIFIVVSLNLFIVGYILIRGIPHLKPSLFSINYTSENVSLTPALITTIYIIIITLIIAFPLGLFTAIYLVEYSKSDSRISKTIRISTEVLSGIPSIIYGLFGFLFFVNKLSLSYSLISGSLTLSIMILPFIIITSEEALLNVDDSYREASIAMGASKLYTIIKVVIPTAFSSIISGVILAIGRIVGESAALIYTLGSVAKIPNNLLSSGRTLAIHMWALSSEGFHSEEAFSTAVILLVFVLMIIIASNNLSKKFNKGEVNEFRN